MKISLYLTTVLSAGALLIGGLAHGDTCGEICETLQDCGYLSWCGDFVDGDGPTQPPDEGGGYLPGDPGEAEPDFDESSYGQRCECPPCPDGEEGCSECECDEDYPSYQCEEPEEVLEMCTANCSSLSEDFPAEMEGLGTCFADQTCEDVGTCIAQELNLPACDDLCTYLIDCYGAGYEQCSGGGHDCACAPCPEGEECEPCTCEPYEFEEECIFVEIDPAEAMEECQHFCSAMALQNYEMVKLFNDCTAGASCDEDELENRCTQMAEERGIDLDTSDSGGPTSGIPEYGSGDDDRLGENQDGASSPPEEPATDDGSQDATPGGASSKKESGCSAVGGAIPPTFPGLLLLGLSLLIARRRL